MATKIRLRRGTASEWTSANPTLESGEVGVETNTKKIKIGDGSTAWNSLTYAVDFSSYATQTYVDNSISSLIDSAPAALDTLNELAAALNDDASFATTVTNPLADKSDKLITTNEQTGTSYTLVLSDSAKLIELNNAAAITLTVPTNASVAFPVGTKIDLLQTGAGQVTVGGAGVTIDATPGLKLSCQWAAASLIKRATDTWVLIGNLSA